jgi:putative ABC transport system permease protein
MYEQIQQLKRSWRTLANKPVFTLMVIGLLALGIAGNAAVFSVFNSLFLRALPFPESDRLVDLDETAPQWKLVHVGVSSPDLTQWRNENSTFESMAFFRRPSYNLSIGDSTQRVLGAQVTHEMLDVLRLRPLIGRNFFESEDKPGRAAVVMLSYGLWKRLFGGNPRALGELVKLDDQPYTVIGILPREAVFPDRAELWVPLAADPNVNSGYYANGVGRLKSRVSVELAQADLLRVHKAMIGQGYTTNRITSPLLTPLRERYVGQFKNVGHMLLGAVVIVLLIACANIAALVMVHASGRSREIAIRVVLGATRGRLAAELFSEAVILAAAGAFLGVLLGYAGTRAIGPLFSDKLPQWISFSLDWHFALFCLVTTVLATVLFGLLPAVQNSDIDVSGSLQDAGPRATHTRRKRVALNAFVVCQTGLALILSISAGLLVQAFRKVTQVDPGFQPANVLSFSVRLPDTSYKEPEKRIAFYDLLLDRLQALPGVRAAGATSAPPLGGQWGGVFEAEGGVGYNPQGDNPTVLQVAVTPGYFRAIGMTLLDGRVFGSQDGEPAPRLVAIVNETFAKNFWGEGTPVGKRIRRVGAKGWLEVAGVLRDEKHYGLDQYTLPSVFLPYATAMATSLRGDERALQEMSVILRTSTDPKLFVDPAREIIRQLDSDVPMYEAQTMTERLDQSLWTRKAYSGLFGAFALIAVILGTAGVYGTVSYRVSQRTREIGVRMALGARRGQVLAQVLLSGMKPALIGVAAGVLGALSTADLLRSWLFGVESRDPATYVTVVLAVTGIALLATLVPARRAAKVDPMVALRYE